MPLGCDPVPAAALAGAGFSPAHRPLGAAAYWVRLAPALAGFGISRVADVTGLDHIGFPVAQAVRPAARSNAVTQGKAPTLAGAALGAVLECLEMAAGEDLRGLTTAPAPADPGLWASRAPGAAWPDADTAWVAAWDLCNDAPAAVPRDLLSTDFSRGAAAEHAPVLRHSIGLGAGPTWSAALMHGLLECIEADARLHGEATGRMSLLDIRPQHPVYGPLLWQVTVAGLRVMAHRMPCRGPAIAVRVSIMERPGPAALPLPATGYAARLNGDAAILAALSEAVQARLAVISGAREDITQAMYRHEVDPDVLRSEWAQHAAATGAPVPRPADPETSVHALACAVGPVFAVPLFWWASGPLAICRVLAPGLASDPLALEGPP